MSWFALVKTSIKFAAGYVIFHVNAVLSSAETVSERSSFCGKKEWVITRERVNN